MDCDLSSLPPPKKLEKICDFLKKYLHFQLWQMAIFFLHFIVPILWAICLISPKIDIVKNFKICLGVSHRLRLDEADT